VAPRTPRATSEAPAHPSHVLTGTVENRTCPACGTGEPHGDDGDPRHSILAVRVERQPVTLATGATVMADVPIDEDYHLDCHAALGCDHCAEVLEHNEGSAKGKTGRMAVHPDHVEIEPHEFVMGPRGEMRRVRTKDEARAHRLEHHQAGPDGEEATS